MSEFKTVWVVYSTDNEYNKREYLSHICETEEIAKVMAKGKGWWGGMGDVVTAKAVMVDGEYYLLYKDTPIVFEVTKEVTEFLDKKAKIAAALEKLTDEEKELLSLN